MTKKRPLSDNHRSRNGCMECRKRRIKCDETRPKCRSCSIKHIDCRYELTLQFKEDLEAKGAAFGREGVWRKKSKTDENNSSDLSIMAKRNFFITINNKTYHFINYSFNDLMNIPSPLQASIIPIEFKDYTGYSVNYALSCYIEHIVPIFNPINITSLQSRKDSQLSTGLNFSSLVQYSQNHPHIFNLLLSIGARFIARTDSSGVWATHSCDFRRAALKELKFELDELQMLRIDDEEVAYDLLLSTLLLCLFDIADDCHDEWSKHLEMAKWLTSKFNIKPRSQLQKETVMFITDFFSYQEAMGRTACKKLSIFESETWSDLDDDNELITWMGCNRKLVNIISDITDLSYERATPGYLIDNSNYLSLTKTIERGIQSLKKIDSALMSDNDDEEYGFLVGCEVKRLATLLYLQCSLLNKTPKYSQAIVRKLNEYLSFLIIRHKYAWSFLLWPIFIMASNIDPLDAQCEYLRSSTLEALKILEECTLGNVNRTRDIILSVWKKRDLFDQKEAKLGKYSNESILGSMNDWEYFVADKRLNISLA